MYVARWIKKLIKEPIKSDEVSKNSNSLNKLCDTEFILKKIDQVKIVLKSNNWNSNFELETGNFKGKNDHLTAIK